jgi:membrane peptidoglycan carboxypeptidase
MARIPMAREKRLRTRGAGAGTTGAALAAGGPGGWVVRMTLALLLAALFAAATIVAIAPLAWRAVNAHSETPIELFDVAGFTGLAERSVVYDVKGRQVGVFQAENSQQVAYEDIPAHVVAALLAVEDRNFMQHRGVDLRAVARQVVSNLGSGSSGGASTITQQVVKNELLATLPRDGRYKLLQMRYAVLLERDVSKERILERWFNTNFYGYNAYGIQAAAEVYFGKSVADLTVMEGAFLVGLVRAPSAYDPIREKSLSLLRYKTVLKRIADVGLIDMTDAEIEALSVAVLPQRVRSRPDSPVARTHFTEMVKEYLLSRPILGDTYQERYNRLFRGGLKIFTTLDLDAQQAADEAVTLMPENSVGAQPALVSLETSTGAIRAMVGGRPFRAGENEVNLAMRRRQTGSSVKIFILAAALEADAEAADLIDGVLPCTLPNPENPAEPFVVTNGVSEPVGPLRRMTALSINCAYAKLSQIVGLRRTVDRIYEMSRSEWLTPELHAIEPYASLATGANEMSPLDMASGAQSIANLGVHHEPHFLLRIEDRDGATTFERTERPGTEVLTISAAAKSVDILKGTLTGGTARRTPLADNRPAAGKTGTQARNTNAWFVGFTPEYTTAVWVGDPRGYTAMAQVPEFRDQIVGQWRFSRNTVTGATYPAHIWKQYMDAVHEGLPVRDFTDDPESEEWKTYLAAKRPPARLYLPGVECVAQIVSGTIPAPTVPGAVRTTTTTTVAPGDVPTETLPSVPDTAVVSVLPTSTTISPFENNKFSPLPSVPIAGHLVYDCARGLPGWARTS